MMARVALQSRPRFFVLGPERHDVVTPDELRRVVARRDGDFDSQGLVEELTMNEVNGSDRSYDGTMHRWKLVVADDMHVNADSLSDVLRLMGHEVMTAYDGLGAIAIHEEFKPDAYILDLGMPGMDGYKTCRAIRALPGGNTVSIVALSGWGRNEDLTRSMEAGFSSFLLKPAHPREILHCLDGICSRKEPPDGLWKDEHLQ